MEDFLACAERVLDHHTAGTLPDYLDDPTECQRCTFYGHTRNPPLSAVGAQVLTDPELEVLLERRERIEGAPRTISIRSTKTSSGDCVACCAASSGRFTSGVSGATSRALRCPRI